MSAPRVDVTIAVHTSTRPIARAVGSVIDHTAAPVRVIVVAHNIESGIIRANLGAYAADPRVEVLELRDGIPSPAGPMNFGFASSTAPFISLIGSDDELEPGAIDSWLAMQRRTGAEAVLARIIDHGRTDPYPPVRGGRRFEGLDAVRDRLAYRSTPVGLLSRERFGQLRLAEGLPSGEDIPYSLSVFFTAQKLAYDLHGPAYVLNEDAEDRVTAEPREVMLDFGFLREVERLEWFAQAPADMRRSIVLKLIRMHFLDAVRARTQNEQQFWASEPDLAAVAEELKALSPGVLGWLSMSHRALVDEITAARPSYARVRQLVDATAHYNRPTALISSQPLLALHSQAPFRTLLAGFLAQRTARPRPVAERSAAGRAVDAVKPRLLQLAGGFTAVSVGASELQTMFV
ncbi:glycosyltransferase [Leucobacter sp. gxy201]|uniref:glycosyltransferase n=1 Tax=Leucobacter sp. gxy201 TaxID=2957200 RepID=UPI003DA007A9